MLRARPSGAVLSEHDRFMLDRRVAAQDYGSKRLLVFRSPGPRFHELIIRAVHAYNIEMGNYNDDADDGQGTGAGSATSAPAPPSLDPLTSDLADRDRLQQQFQLGAVQTPRANHNK